MLNIGIFNNKLQVAVEEEEAQGANQMVASSVVPASDWSSVVRCSVENIQGDAVERAELLVVTGENYTIFFSAYHIFNHHILFICDNEIIGFFPIKDMQTPTDHFWKKFKSDQIYMKDLESAE